MFKQRFLSRVSVSALFFLFVAVCWMAVLRERSKATSAQEAFEAERQKWMLFIDEVGHPTPEHLHAEKKNIQTLSELEAQLLQSLLAPTKEGQLKEESGRPADLVFRIQSLVDRLTQEAEQNNVALMNSAKTFGFGSVLKDAMPPSVKELELVGRECQLMDVLGHYLIAAKPHQIFKIEREGNMSTDFKRSDETFSPQSASIQRLQEHFSVICFRFSFVGKTQNLRTFLNDVSNAPWPLFITDVSVTPSTSEFGSAAQKPIIAGGGSHFQVTIAWLGELS